MLRYLLTRVLQLPLVLFGVTFAIFTATMALPVELRAAAYITSEQQVQDLPAVIRTYGLDRDPAAQYLSWVTNLAQGNLGWSVAAKQPVGDVLKSTLPATIELALIAFVPTVTFSLLLGLIAALRPHGLADQLIRFGSIVTHALPSFVVGIALLAVFYGHLRWFEPGRVNTVLALTEGLDTSGGFLLFPALLQGRWTVVADVLRHMVLPAATITIVSVGPLTQVIRANITEQLGQDYVRTALAKGLTRPRVTVRHVLRNALLPVITLLGSLTFGLLSGVVITETVFNYPGLGSWAAQAALLNDTSGVLGFALLSALVVAVVNLVVDLAYSALDPRVRYDA